MKVLILAGCVFFATFLRALLKQLSRESKRQPPNGSGRMVRKSAEIWELRNIYHHHPESKKRKSSEANSGSIHPYGRYENAVKTRKTISTIAILWPVKAIFEKRAATVEVDSFVSPGNGWPKTVTKRQPKKKCQKKVKKKVQTRSKASENGLKGAKAIGVLSVDRFFFGHFQWPYSGGHLGFS